MSEELDEKLARFEQRKTERKPQADEEERVKEQQRIDELRQGYLNRTKRKDLTP